MKRFYNGELLPNARSLRKDMTPWERKLWHCFLRGYPAKVYRQRVIDAYSVDFCCPSAKLIIELDGSQHFDSDQAEHDAKRTARLEALGYAVLRIPNVDIDRHFQEVCALIDREIQSRKTSFIGGHDYEL